MINDELMIFTKSMNAVRLLENVGNGEWRVERISGSSKGKQMICREKALRSIDSVIAELPYPIGSVEITTEVVELLRTKQWPVIIDLNDDAGVDQFSVLPVNSGYWLDSFESKDQAKNYIIEKQLIINE